MRRKKNERAQPQVNLGYPAFQLAKALLAAQEQADPEARARAQTKVQKWEAVLRGLLSGKLRVGSRTPVPEFPPWVTLEVVTGGFATGAPLAGGPLLDHERDLLKRLSLSETREARQALNSYYVTDDGLGELMEMAGTRKYSLSAPEEGALVAISLLVKKRSPELGRDVLQRIAYLFPYLRFYPIPGGEARIGDERVVLQDVGSTMALLRRIKPNLRVLTQKEAVEIWAPLYDEAVSLVLETTGGSPPRFLKGFQPRDRNPEGVKFTEDSGWPGTSYPPGWRKRAQDFLNRYERARRVHRLCNKPDRPGENFPQLRRFIWRALHDYRN